MTVLVPGSGNISGYAETRSAKAAPRKNTLMAPMAGKHAVMVKVSRVSSSLNQASIFANVNFGTLREPAYKCNVNPWITEAAPILADEAEV